MGNGYRLNIPLIDEKIYIELNDLDDFIKEEFKKRYQKNMDQFLEEIHRRDARIEDGLLKAMDQLFQETIALQKNGCKKTIQYMSFSFLWSSAILGTNEVQVNLYAEESYLDPCESQTYWKADTIMEYCKKDIEELDELAQKKVLHYGHYEYLQLRDKVYAIYHFVLMKYLIMVVDQIVKLDSFQELVKKEISITYGGYLDRQIKIWPTEKEEG